MIDISIKFDDKITPGLNKIKRDLQRYPEQAVQEYRRLTPVDKGFARRQTQLRGRDTIVRDYDYAEVLDRGRRVQGRQMRGSRQAPDGMTRPFIKWVQAQMARIFRI
jgi:hypothetical protein